MTRRLNVAAVSATAAAALLLAGCSSGPTSSTGATSGGSAATANTVLHDALPQAIKDAGVITFAGDSHPPYRTVEADGRITGIDPDIQEALARILGVKAKTETVASLPAALQGMLSGRYDAFNGPVKATAEREKDFDSITWMTTRTAYIVPKATGAGVAATDDLCGKTVAVVTASIVEEQLKKLSAYCEGKGASAIQVLGLADTNSTLLAANAGRAAAAGMTEAAAIDVRSKEPDKYLYVRQTEAQGATTDNLATLVPKSSGLGPVLMKAFQELFANGDYRRIMEKYHIEGVAVPAPILNVASKG